MHLRRGAGPRTSFLVERTANLLSFLSYFTIGVEGTTNAAFIGIEARFIGHSGALNGERSGKGPGDE